MNDDDVVESVAQTTPQAALEPETPAAAEPAAPPDTAVLSAPEATPLHPGHALIDEISSNLSVQYKPSWIREKLEQLRALL